MTVFTVSPDTFFSCDLCVGTVFSCELNPTARKAAYVVTIDFGPEIGTRVSSAQVTELYMPRRGNLPCQTPPLDATSPNHDHA